MPLKLVDRDQLLFASEVCAGGDDITYEYTNIPGMALAINVSKAAIQVEMKQFGRDVLGQRPRSTAALKSSLSPSQWNDCFHAFGTMKCCTASLAYIASLSLPRSSTTAVAWAMSAQGISSDLLADLRRSRIRGSVLR